MSKLIMVRVSDDDYNKLEKFGRKEGEIKPSGKVNISSIVRKIISKHVNKK